MHTIIPPYGGFEYTDIPFVITTRQDDLKTNPSLQAASTAWQSIIFFWIASGFALAMTMKVSIASAATAASQ